MNSYHNTHTQVLCDTSWIPARVEFECIRGEGVIFYFPNKECNFFNTSQVG